MTDRLPTLRGISARHVRLACSARLARLACSARLARPARAVALLLAAGALAGCEPVVVTAMGWYSAAKLALEIVPETGGRSYIARQTEGRLSAADTALLAAAAARALEYTAAGGYLDWTSPDTGARARIRPSRAVMAWRPVRSALAEGVVEAPLKEVIGRAYLAARDAELRAGPGPTHALTGGLRARETFTAIARVADANWLLVGRDGRATGYVYAPYVRPVEAAPVWLREPRTASGSTIVPLAPAPEPAKPEAATQEAPAPAPADMAPPETAKRTPEPDGAADTDRAAKPASDTGPDSAKPATATGPVAGREAKPAVVSVWAGPVQLAAIPDSAADGAQDGAQDTAADTASDASDASAPEASAPEASASMASDAAPDAAMPRPPAAPQAPALISAADILAAPVSVAAPPATMAPTPCRSLRYTLTTKYGGARSYRFRACKSDDGGWEIAPAPAIAEIPRRAG